LNSSTIINVNEFGGALNKYSFIMFTGKGKTSNDVTSLIIPSSLFNRGDWTVFGFVFINDKHEIKVYSNSYGTFDIRGGSFSGSGIADGSFNVYGIS
jgi:hypothetical protein